MKESYFNTDYQEQETTIVIDYCKSLLTIYSSKKAQIERLKAKLGKATVNYYTNHKISGSKWEIPFKEKRKITSALSRPLLIGNIK